MAESGDPVLACWTQAPDGRPRTFTIHPDGCRDLIVRTRPDGRCHWFMTDLADAAYTVGSDGRDGWLGFRLQPGTAIDCARVLAGVQRLTPDDARQAQVVLAEQARPGPGTAEWLAALATAPRVAQAARQAGLGERVFERRVRAATQRPPAYWLQLARVRRAARLLATPLPLAEVAAAAGYVDQSHLSRACRRWFGAAPAALRADVASLMAATLTGYA